MADDKIFPNAPGLAEKLGLRRYDEVPPLFIGEGKDRKRFYSICSAHQNHDSDCPRCKVGSYHPVTDETQSDD